VSPVRDFLSRFRPAGAPGAGRAGVPVDRHRELEAEIGPVLLLLDGPSAECAGLIAAARQDAEQVIAAARAEAEGILAAARQQAAARTAELVHQAVTAAQGEAADIAAAGTEKAAAIRQCAGQRLPTLVARAVALVREIDDEGRPP